ncbi:flavin reductase [Streptomyces caniscabiei]|uniref:flavin reductase n=1 Tax=Streptomyces caniscabiei TaxID=2746961 RepID=UPI0038F674CD
MTTVLDCREFVGMVDDLLDADEETWQAEVVQHLKDCPPCEVYLEQLQDVRRLLRGMDTETLPNDDPRVRELLDKIDSRPRFTLVDEDAVGHWQPEEVIEPQALKAVAGAFPSGVTVITTAPAGKPVGMTVSSFTSVSLDPPLILVCVARTASCLPAFRVGSPMGVNVLSGGQAHVAKTFASPVEDRFAVVEHRTGPHGVPLIEETAAWLSTHIVRIYDGGDHVILLARVHALRRSAHTPLLYQAGALHDWKPTVVPPSTGDRRAGRKDGTP